MQNEPQKQIREVSLKRLDEVRNKKEMWATLAKETQDYFNSADEAKFFITKGRCKKLPEHLTEILHDSLNSNVPLLREATDEELLKEFDIQEEERLIAAGKLPVKKLTEDKLKL